MPTNPPSGTYRVQLGPGTGFADLGALAGYLDDLGVSHAYLSPVLAATPGSTHGYDAVDHAAVSPELGGEQGFREAAGALADRSVRILLDVVPNHMAIPVPEHLNAQLWSVLREGPRSAFAHWFDVDWSGDGRLMLPVLGQPLAACLDAGEITVDTTGGPQGEPVVRYFDHRFPVAVGTSDGGLQEVLDAQHYRLVSWRRGNDEINYRRFFDVDTLVGLRVEDPDVFAATHALLLRLRAEGLVDGFRVDHVDGLVDPRGYLARLTAAGGQPWLVVEKILLGEEELPADWACDGTTGYDALWRIGGVFVDPAGALALRAGFGERTGEVRGWPEVEQESRRLVLSALLGAEVDRLATLAVAVVDEQREQGEQGLRGITEALVELLVAMPVYRLYVVPGEPPSDDVVAAWDDVVAEALARAPHRADELALVRDLALGRFGRGDSRDEFVVRFQQTCGPAVAKGVEDTAGYRWAPVSSLNEVGSDPDRLGLGAQELHDWAATRGRAWPGTMNALSTHDTKRSEDVRARITALTEAPEAFLARVDSWNGLLAGVDRVEPGLAWLLWQTLVGAHPISGDRLQGFLLKAARESKLRTSWLAPDAAYEQEVHRLADAALGEPAVLAGVRSLLDHLEPSVAAGVLGQRALQLVLPGVPDIYQGCEALSLRLVDPDNRERPDWAALRASLDRALSGPVDPGSDLSLAKLRLTALGLRLRRERPASFGPGSAYAPVGATGARAEHVVGVLRTDVAVSSTRLALRLQEAGGWGDTRVDLPDGRWLDLLSEQEHRASGGVPAAELHAAAPVALLVRTD